MEAGSKSNGQEKAYPPINDYAYIGDCSSSGSIATGPSFDHSSEAWNFFKALIHLSFVSAAVALGEGHRIQSSEAYPFFFPDVKGFPATMDRRSSLSPFILDRRGFRVPKKKRRN
jgi:hypothetical protein